MMVCFLSIRQFLAVVFVGMIVTMTFIPANSENAPTRFVIENSYYRYAFDTSQGLKLTELYNTFTKDNNLKDPTNLHLATIDVNGERSTLDTMAV